jgi:plastocyanin
VSVLTGSSTPIRRRGAVLALALALGGLTAGSDNSGDTSAGGATTTAAAQDTSGSAAQDTSGSAAASSSSPAGDAAQPVAVNVTEKNFRIALDNSNLSAGQFTFTIANQDQATHNLAIEKDGTTIATSPIIQPGKSGTLTANLEPGSYVFYCGVGAHRANGMELDVDVS